MTKDTKLSVEQMMEEIIPPEGYRWLRPDEWPKSTDLSWSARRIEKPNSVQVLSNGYHVHWVCLSWQDLDVREQQQYKTYIRKARIDVPFWGLLQC